LFGYPVERFRMKNIAFLNRGQGNSVLCTKSTWAAK